MSLRVAALVAWPALAALENGETPGPKLGIAAAIGIFVGIPLALFLIVALLVMLPGLLRRPRYRPGRPWTADPVWFAGPEDAQLAIRSAVPSLQAKGGVSAEW